MTRAPIRLPFLCALALAACAPRPASAGRASRSSAAEPAAGTAPAGKSALDWHAPLGKKQRLEVATVLGDVRIEPASGGEARVRAFKSGRDADRIRVEVKEHGDTITIHTVYPEHAHDLDARVDFVVQVPADRRTEAETVNGDITAHGVRGTLRLESVQGDIDVAGPSTLEAETVNGKVSAALEGEGPSHLSAVNGGVEVILPARGGARLQASTVSGSIDSDVPLDRPGGGRFAVGDTGSAVVGDGRMSLELSTVNGPIRIRKGRAG